MEKTINLNTNFIDLYSKGLDRAFKNIYSVKFMKNGSELSPEANLSFLPESISLGNDEVMTEYNDANKNHFIVNAGTFKNCSITFRETSDFSILKFFQNYLQTRIFNFQENYFHDGNPTLDIYIYLSVMDDITDPRIRIERAIPTALQYPDVSWSSSEPQTTTISFSVDRGYVVLV